MLYSKIKDILEKPDSKNNNKLNKNSYNPVSLSRAGYDFSVLPLQNINCGRERSAMSQEEIWKQKPYLVLYPLINTAPEQSHDCWEFIE